MHNREERLFLIGLASDDPDMDAAEAYDYYLKYAMRSKEDLLHAIGQIKIYLTSNSNKRSEACLDRLSKLLDKFYLEVEKMYLMKELHDWWGYEISVRETGISLKLSHFTILYDMNLLPSETKNTTGTLISDEDFTIYKLQARLLSLEEFGVMHGVASDTVRQWIRRGKIRSAVKLGNDWRIPELCEMPTRGYQFGDYYWNEEIPNPPEEVPDINDYDNVHIQSAKERGMWNVMFGHEYMDDIPDRKMLKMTNKEKEKLELYMIAHPLIKCPSNYLGDFQEKDPFDDRKSFGEVYGLDSEEDCE